MASQWFITRARGAEIDDLIILITIDYYLSYLPVTTFDFAPKTDRFKKIISKILLSLGGYNLQELGKNAFDNCRNSALEDG